MTLASTTKWRSKSPEYKAYQDAKSRCTNVNHRLWFYYGGRGIRFLFTSFDEFIGIIGTRPDNFTLDRIDNNGNYEPMNVRWASKSTQMSNRRAYKIPWREAVEKAKQIAQVMNTEITENVHDQIWSYTKLIHLNEVTVNGYEKKMIQLFRDYLPDMRTINVIATKSREIVHILDNDEFSI